ncbi:WD40 repeat-like protein [Dacryopinax primogenitus]|uniref:WD40 repeat-like protein n=1 Tax=Dacryopinax primogenitus (strain DJM 731) TaxID=1858805 RepID=M5FVP8_DACPD|nr:WD40 repeat-like protein [Dacryopinax primogenitus]EJT97431.1 WD40 repeat-like protein [Dacryopinax primogenitus]
MGSKSLLRYDAPWPIFTLDWCNSSGAYPSTKASQTHRLALGSFLESSHNALQIIGAASDTLDDYYPPSSSSEYFQQQDFVLLAETQHGYPATKLLWEPAGANGHAWKFKPRLEAELLATSGEVLKIWEYDAQGGGRRPAAGYVGRGASGVPGSLREVQKCSSAKGNNVPAPLTSFAWNAISPSLIVTSSIDTTCTVWDITSNSAITQLIAHDKDVYDVAWLPHSTDSFVSVGADGSLRAFDLRSLEHSTILYESPPREQSRGSDEMVVTPATLTGASSGRSAPPLARVQFSPTDSNYIAMFHLESNKVTIIDMRTPGRPLAELVAHGGNVNAIGWGQCEAMIASAGDDHQLLLWDLSSSVMSPHRVAPTDITNLPPPGEVRDPVLAYTAPGEINSLAWSYPMVGGVWGQTPVEWVAVTEGRSVRALRV